MSIMTICTTYRKRGVHIHVLWAHCPKSNWTSTLCKEKEGYTHLYVVLPHCLCSRIGLRGSGDEATGLYTVDHRENDREIYCSHVWQELRAPMQGEIAGADVCLWVKLHSLHFFLLCCWIYNKQQKEHNTWKTHWISRMYDVPGCVYGVETVDSRFIR